MRFGTCNQSPKSKEKFINEPYLTKIAKIRAFCGIFENYFLKKSNIFILVSGTFRKLQIGLIKSFNYSKTSFIGTFCFSSSHHSL